MQLTHHARFRPGLNVAVIVICGAAGGLASAGVRIPFISASGFVLISALAAAAALLVFGRRNPLVPFAALLLLFPLTDIARKLGDASPQTVIAKDVVLLLALAVLSIHASPWRDAARASARWLRPLGIFAVWYVVVACTNSFVQFGVALPAIGVRLFFEFLPLVGVGWYLAINEERLARAVRFLCVVLCAVTLLGIVQAAIGPSFLAPRAPIEGFTHLNLVRRTLGQTSTVFQPSGAFAEPSRFANWAFITFVLGLSLLPHRSAGRWRIVVLCIGSLGVFAASNRTLIVASVAVLVSVALWNLRRNLLSATRLIVIVLFVAVALGLATQTLYPDQFKGRVEFVTRSLSLGSEDAEITERAPGYVGATMSAIRRGGLVGRGAGTQGLGRQYVEAGGRTELLAEGGFASIAGESGLIGLVFWVVWTATAVTVCFRFVRRARGQLAASLATLSFGLAAQLFVVMWIVVGAIQDFVFNAWLFLVLGAIAALGTTQQLQGDERSAQERIDGFASIEN